MSRIATLWTGYETYWGLDSFRGLPEEANETYRNKAWFAGAYPLVRTRVRKGVRKWEPVETAVAAMQRQLNNTPRVQLVPGFYNDSLTSELAGRARAAAYIDINCDLYISSMQAMDWLFAGRLVQPGSIVMYDDWFNTPFNHGESRVHLEIAQKYQVAFRLLFRCSGDSQNNLVMFRVDSIGSAARPDVPLQLREYKVWD